MTTAKRALLIVKELLSRMSSVRFERNHPYSKLKLKITENDEVSDVRIKTSTDNIHITISEEDATYLFSEYDILILTLYASHLHQNYVTSHKRLSANDIEYGEYYNPNILTNLTDIFQMPKPVFPQLPDNMPPFDTQRFHKMYILKNYDPTYSNLYMSKYEIYKLIYHHVLSKVDPNIFSRIRDPQDLQAAENIISTIFDNISINEKHDMYNAHDVLDNAKLGRSDYLEAIDTYIVYLPDFPFAPGVAPDITLTPQKKG